MKRGPGRQRLDRQDVNLTDEVRYIQGCAAEHDGRIITIGQVVLFSSESGDAWLLDPADQLAVPVARDGDPLPVEIHETATKFGIGWAGRYQIDGEVFIFEPYGLGRVIAIVGYPTRPLSRQISHTFG